MFIWNLEEPNREVGWESQSRQRVMKAQTRMRSLRREYSEEKGAQSKEHKHGDVGENGKRERLSSLPRKVRGMR